MVPEGRVVRYTGGMDSPLRVENIERSMARTYAWIQRVGEELADSVTPRQAYGILRGLLQVLRDRLPVPQAANFAAQLPEYLRGVYYEGWEPARVPVKVDDEEFERRFVAAANLPQDIDGEEALRAAMRAIRSEMTGGEVQKVLDSLPDRLQALLGD